MQLAASQRELSPARDLVRLARGARDEFNVARAAFRRARALLEEGERVARRVPAEGVDRCFRSAILEADEGVGVVVRAVGSGLRDALDAARDVLAGEAEPADVE